MRIGEPDPEGGVITALSRVDLDYIDRWIEQDVLPISLVLDQQQPASQGDPVPMPQEELTEGSHLGYAVQWFAFAAIAIVGAGFLIYRAGTQDPTRRTEPDPAPRP